MLSISGADHTLAEQILLICLDQRTGKFAKSKATPERNTAMKSPSPFAVVICLCIGMAGVVNPALAQNAAPESTTEPAAPLAGGAQGGLIRWTGTLPEAKGQTAEVHFALYADQVGGLALWSETQAVKVDTDGRYSVLLGATSAEGLPQNLFQAGEARWIEARLVRADGVPDALVPARSLLAAVPYAFKSVDADTLAGRPAADYVTQEDLRTAAGAVAQAASQVNPLATGVTGTGAKGMLPVWTGTGALGNSMMTESGMKVGVGTATPATTLDVNGASTLRGAVSLPSVAATAAAGASSPALELEASAFSSTSNTAVTQKFAWQAASAGNKTAKPSANLELLFGAGTGPLRTTGLAIAPTGLITFAAGQAFPGTGAISGVTAGTGLKGGGTNGTVSLSIDPAVVPTLAASNTFTGTANTFANPVTFQKLINFAPGQTFPGGGGGTITSVATSSPLTGGASAGAVTVGLNAAALETTLNGVYSQLSAANSFNGTQTIASGDLALAATTGANSGGISINGVPFLQGYPGGSKNVFVGGAGNFTNSGSFNVSAGYQSLLNLSSGTGNTAVGDVALFLNSGGSNNTAVGNSAMFSNSSGTLNTAIGATSGTVGGGLTNATALGAGSTVAQSNSLVLGQTNGNEPGVNFVNVGIGTGTPRSIFEVAASATSQLGPVITLTNPAGGAQAKAAIDFNTSTPSTAGAYNPGARIVSVDDGSYSDDLFFFSNKPGADNNGLALNMVIASNGQVGIGTSVPCCNGQLVVQSSASAQEAIEALGVTGTTGVGIAGINGSGGDSTGTGDAGIGGVFEGGNNYENGTAGDGVWAYQGKGGEYNGYAGLFNGDVIVAGLFEALSKDFKIDHPSDPANKYLVHSSVESSEMMNIYTGNVLTDELGIAVVTLPKWFEVLNTDFRYQLTVIGRKAQAWISQEVQDGRFIISSDATHVKVSWQITAVRQDPYAKAHPLVVEQEKNIHERGFYLTPELYGQPEEKQTEWGRHPEQMRRMKAEREAQKNKPASGVPATPAVDQPASAVNRPVTPASILRQCEGKKK